MTPNAIVFDYIKSSYFLVRAIVEGATERFIPVVLVPHGTGMRASDVKPMRNLPASDYKLVQSEYYGRLYEDNSPAQVEILGCARYCDEWEEKYGQLVVEEFPTLEVGSKNEKLNVLFFERPKIGFFVDHDTVAAALELEFVNVLFKGKPRRKGNRIIPNEDIPSARLVQWADVVVSSISGIVLEALWQKKPVIYLKYLAPADIAIFEQYGACWSVNSQEELFSSLKVLNENPDYRAYPQANVDRLFEEMIYAGDRNRDVLQGYADFFSELLEKTRKQQ
jgi:hypothetical protein